MPRFLLCLLLLAAPLPAQESDVRDLLSRWARDLEDVRSLRVEFAQTKTLRILRRPRTSRGEVHVVGERLKMVVRGASGEVETILAVAGGEARLYHPSLARLEIYPATSRSAARAPFPMFGGDVEALPDLYEIRFEREGDREILELTPRDPESRTARMRLEFEGGRLVSVEQVDRRGDSVAIEILAFEKNPDLPPGAAEFEVPEGTRIVRPLDAEGSR